MNFESKHFFSNCEFELKLVLTFKDPDACVQI